MRFIITLKEESLLIGVNNGIKNYPIINKTETKIKTIVEGFKESDLFKIIKFICKTEPFIIDGIDIENGDFEDILSRILPNNYDYRLVIVVKNEDIVRSEYDKPYNEYIVCVDKEFIKKLKEEIINSNIKIVRSEKDNAIVLSRYENTEWNFYKKIQEYSKNKKIAFFDKQKHIWYFY